MIRTGKINEQGKGKISKEREETAMFEHVESRMGWSYCLTL